MEWERPVRKYCSTWLSHRAEFQLQRKVTKKFKRLCTQLPMAADVRPTLHYNEHHWSINYIWKSIILMICWRSFSEWGISRVASTFANEGCQSVGYELQWTNHLSAMLLTRTKIVDTVLMLICFPYRLPILSLYITTNKSLVNYLNTKTKHHWHSAYAHCHNGVTRRSCNALPEQAASTSYMNNCNKLPPT